MEEPLVNLTPLIDVVFVVLIMFILVAPLLELDQIALAPSTPNSVKDTAALQEQRQIKIHVKNDDTIWYRKQLVTPEVLRSLLKEVQQNHPQAIPLIFHDKRARFGTYQEVKGACESAGFTQMDIVLKPG